MDNVASIANTRIVPAYGFWRLFLRRKNLLAVVLVCVAIVVAEIAGYLLSNRSDGAPVTNRPIEVLANGYVGSKSCRECHSDNYESWHASYHSTMTQVASSDAVLAPFDGVQLERRGKQYHLFAGSADDYCVEIRDTNAASGSHAPDRRQVVLATGSHHLQCYWMSMGESRQLEVLPFAYRIASRNWQPIEAVFLLPPENADSAAAADWNSACIRCHTTNGRPRFLSESVTDSHVAEFGISCEACHGSGEKHVQSQGEDLSMVNPSQLSPRRSAEVCGQCHSTTGSDHGFASKSQMRSWNKHGPAYRPGDELREDRIVSTGPNASHFWSDGMVRVSGREYNGLIKSPCFTHGNDKQMMTCLSCHTMHRAKDDPRSLLRWANDQLKWEMDSNRPGYSANNACTQCHTEYQTEERLAAHSHHEPNSSGSSCYNCHMPHTAWGLMKAMRSHQIDSPSVGATLATGRPNACNLCHLDKSLHWTAQKLRQWYQQPMVSLSTDQRQMAASVLDVLSGDAGQRALAAWNMGWDPARENAGTEWMAPLLAQLLEDPYDLVRSIAHRSLRKVDGFEDFEFDFMGPRQHQAEANRRAVQLWNRRERARDDATGAAILLDAKGDLQRDVFDRLLLKRNDQPVLLAE